MRGVIRAYWQELANNTEEELHLGQLQAKTFIPSENEETLFDKIDIDINKLKIATTPGKVLTQREFEILRVTYEFRGKIPKKLRQDICRYWKISDTTIRTIRSRALKKIKDYVKTNNLVIN